jgi:hypothetical protein
MDLVVGLDSSTTTAVPLEAARVLCAAHAIRERMGAVRIKVLDAGYEASVAAARDALGDKDFDSAWAEGAALSTEEAIAYAQRGHGERKRPASGWASLTPPSATSSGSSAKEWPITTSPHGFSSRRARCKPTSPTSTPNWASPHACSSPKRQPATPERTTRARAHARRPIKHAARLSQRRAVGDGAALRWRGRAGISQQEIHSESNGWPCRDRVWHVTATVCGAIAVCPAGRLADSAAGPWRPPQSPSRSPSPPSIDCRASRGRL